MATITYRPNHRQIDELLYGRNGAVQLHVSNTGRQAEGAARRRVGVKSGKLKASIGSRIVGAKLGKGFNFELFANTPYAVYHHDGTSPHVIRPRNARVLRFQVGGVVVYAMHVQHPGTKPNRFLLEAIRDVGLNPKSSGRF